MEPLTQIQIENLLWEMDHDDWQEQFADAGSAYITQAYQDAGYASLQEIDNTKEFDMEDAVVVAAILAILLRYSRHVRDTALKDIRTSLEQALEDGLSVVEARARLADLMLTPFLDRAELISITEINRSINAALLESFRQSGFITKKVWRTVPGACNICVPYDGMVLSIEMPFIELGESIPFINEAGNQAIFTNTYNTVLYPPAHCRCRCYIEGISEIALLQ